VWWWSSQGRYPQAAAPHPLVTGFMVEVPLPAATGLRFTATHQSEASVVR
jgi:hypothetical protein